MKRLLKLWALCTAAMLCSAFITGCGGGGGGGSADSNPAPSVVYTTPVNDEADVGTASKITVTFSEAMKEDTIKTESFKLENITTDTPTTVTLSSVKYDTANKIATITPSALEANQEYRVTVNAVVKDTSGKAMQSAYPWTFKTGATVGVAPQLASKAPVAGAINVGTNTAVVMSFTKPMDINTFNSSSFTLQKTLDASTVAGTFSLVGKVVVFTPSAPIAKDTDYTATVTTQAKDTSGIALAAPVSWSFTTGSGADVKRPVGDILQASPTGTVADLRPAMSIPFNEPVYPFLFGTIDDDKAVEVEFDYSPSGVTTVTMTPTADRAPGTYTTGIAVSDLAHNKSYTYTWSFTIVSPP